MDCYFGEIVTTDCTKFKLDSELRKLLLDEYPRALRYMLEIRVLNQNRSFPTVTGQLPLRTLSPVHEDEFNDRFIGKDFIDEQYPISSQFLFARMFITHSRLHMKYMIRQFYLLKILQIRMLQRRIIRHFQPHCELGKPKSFIVCCFEKQCYVFFPRLMEKPLHQYHQYQYQSFIKAHVQISHFQVSKIFAFCTAVIIVDSLLFLTIL